MSDRHQLHLELAWAVADARPREADVTRLARAAGLAIPDLPTYARPVDTWIAVIAAAADAGKMDQLLDTIVAEVPSIEKAKFRPLVVQEGTRSAPAIALSLEWRDLDDTQKQERSRTVRGGKALPVTAIVRVFGSAERPELTWSWRRFFSFTSRTVAPAPEGEPGRNFSVWRFDETFTAGELATSRLVVDVAVGGVTDRAARTVSTEAGRWCAIAIVVITAAVTFYLLSRLPDVDFALGISGGVVSVAMLIVRALFPRIEGPAWGLAVPERAVIAALLVIGGATLVPRWAFVVVENTTDETVLLKRPNGTTFSIDKHDRWLIRRDQRPVRPIDDQRFCVCGAGAATPECPCPSSSNTEGMDVERVACRAPTWQGTPLPMKGCAVDVERVRPKRARASELVEGTTVVGEVEVRYPWPDKLEPLLFTRDALTTDASVLLDQDNEPIIKLLGIREDFRVPALAPSLRVDFADGGHLDCTIPPGRGDVRVRALAAGTTGVEANAGGVRSVYSGSASARICARGDAIDDVALRMPTPPSAGALPLPQPMPTTLAYAFGTRRYPSRCEGQPTALVEVSTRPRAPVDDQLDARMIPTDPRIARIWSIRGVAWADRMFGIVCDPPETPTAVTFEGSDRTEWVLSKRALIKKPPRAPSAYCRVHERWSSLPESASTWAPLARCQSSGSQTCKQVEADDLEAQTKAKAHGCRRLCACS